MTEDPAADIERMAQPLRAALDRFERGEDVDLGPDERAFFVDFVGTFKNVKQESHKRQARGDVNERVAVYLSVEDKIDELLSLIEELLNRVPASEAEPTDGGAAPTGRRRHGNRQIALPWREGTAFLMPNIHNGGTRKLGLAVAGGLTWQPGPNGGTQIAMFGPNDAAAMIDLTNGPAGVVEFLGPKGIKAMIAVSRLLWEKTGHQPVNRAATLTVGEIARAMGYKPNAHRSIDREISTRVAGQLRLLTRIQTWAADGPYDKKTKGYASAWTSPLLVVTGIHGERVDLSDEYVPYEFDAMLGRNWAEAMAEFDVLQVAPGFMDLDEDSAILLAWFYLTEFRYRMTKPRGGVRRGIGALCTEAGIEPGSVKHRGRFLTRLHQWHAQLSDLAIIGSYERDPAIDANLPPGEIFARGKYAVTLPPALAQAYADARQKAAERRAAVPRRR